MKIKHFLKIILLISSGSSIVLSTSLTSYNSTSKIISEVIDKNKELRIEGLRQHVKKNSHLLQKEKKYIYDGRTFSSEEEIDEHLFNKGLIKMKMTSTNPLDKKVVKDVETGLLNYDLIYDTKINNYKQWFRDVNGNIVESRQKALDTYINEGNIKTQYSYDGINWFNTENDAKEKVSKNIEVKKSYYYVYNNQYYNAFNIQDINDFMKTMKDGYYGYFDKNLSGKNIEKHEELWGRSDVFGERAASYFRKDFFTDYHKKLINFQGRNQFKMLKKNKSFDVKINGNSVFLLEDSFVFSFVNTNFLSFSDMINDFTDKSKWNIVKSNNKINYERTFVLYVNENYQPNVKVTLLDINDDDNLSKEFIYQDESYGKINFYLDEQHRVQFYPQHVSGNKPGLYVPLLTGDEITEFYEEWIDQYRNEVLFNFEEKNQTELTWDMVKNEDYIKNNNSNFHAGDLLKDKIYEASPGSGYGVSLIKSMKDWQIQKQIIIDTAKGLSNSEKNKLGDKIYKINNDLNVDKTALDNFLNLFGYGIDFRTMYSINDEDHPSDRKGRMLYSTEFQAKEAKKILSTGLLKKRFVVFGKNNINPEPVYGDDVNDFQDILRKFQNQIKLSSRFVHNDEIEYLQKRQNEIKWNDLVGTSRYIVYSIYNKIDGKEKYYQTRKHALKALKPFLNLELEPKISIVEEPVYLYNWITKENEIVPLRYKKRHFESIVQQLYRYKMQLN